MGPELLLDQVHDRDTFVSFVRALADERERAAEIEAADPKRYQLDGAFDWKTGDIAAFLYACLTYFDGSALVRPAAEPSWRMMADLLYRGKIVE